MKDISGIGPIDTRQFIDEVRKRKAIWEVSGRKRGDKMLRRSQWEDLCVTLIPEFSQQSSREKTVIRLHMQKKWKHIRDALIKSLRCRGQRMKPYAYEENLAFLNISSQVFCGSTMSELQRNELVDSDSKDSSDDQSVDSEVTQDFDQVDTPPTIHNGSETTKETRNESNFYTVMKSLHETPKQKQPNAGSECDDMHFFRSLMPMVEPLSLRQKMKFRMEIMQKALEISNNDKPTPRVYETLRVTHEPSTSGSSTEATKRPGTVGLNDSGSSTSKRLKEEVCEIDDDNYFEDSFE
ncbi:uncharacterized protein LOC131684029 [Topomyia yanbarensis]|uniref:uncharacterized protein LOC131684029 n=1 Tax=Topomyia yanbarensis TaxID=2498891 RepID=UPI00273AAA87|nr:uncharacterized protein LOC131684029 [Topomyia yanbarensis]